MESLIARAFPASERRVGRQAFWLGTLLPVQVLGGLATVSLSARILGAEGLGVLAVIALLTFTAGNLLNIGQDAQDVMLLYGAGGVLTAMNGETLAVLRLADRVQLQLVVIVASRVVGVGLLAVVWLTGGGLTEVVLAHVAAAAVNGLGMFAAAAISAPLAGLAGFLRSASLKIPPDVARFHAGAFWELKITTLVDNVERGRHTAGAVYRSGRRGVVPRGAPDCGHGKTPHRVDTPCGAA